MDIRWLKKFENKKILLLGYGLEGKSTYQLLKRYCGSAELQIMDRNSDYVTQCFEQRDMPYIYSDAQYLNIDEDVDYVFKSPGIPMKQLENHMNLSLVTSQSNEFIGAYREMIVGITGTKGKSTTASFLYQLLKAYDVKVELVGNIGKPAFDCINEASEIDTFIYELSSHQLETVEVSPKYCAVLNLFEEHLDHYHSYDHYAEAKMNIGRYQTSKDLFVYNSYNDEIGKRMKGFRGQKATISLTMPEQGIYDQKDGVTLCYGNPLTLDDSIERKLMGHHNLVNMVTGLLFARALGFEDSGIELEMMSEFKGLPHRLAYVKTVRGIDFYNDSIATIPLATIAAIKAIPKVATLIVGGLDRGIDYSVLVAYIDNHPELHWLLLPDSGHKIFEQLKGTSSAYKVETMSEAVKKAVELTDSGKACILSPAAASYGFYKNFEGRGDDFEKCVNDL